MKIYLTERKIFPDITILSVHSHDLSKTLNLIQKHNSNRVIYNVSVKRAANVTFVNHLILIANVIK